MANLKAFINFLDVFFATVWGFTVLEVVPIVIFNGYASLFTNLDGIIKLSFAFVGLVYAIMRAYFYFHKSNLSLKIQKEELKEMKINNRNSEEK